MVEPVDELVEVVDEEDRVVDVVPRRVVRERLLLHRCTYVVVLDPLGRVYVHRRTESKDVYPGFYDVIAGGVNGVGESYERCAAREVEEELGITARPTFRFTHRYEGPDGRCFGGVFDVVWDGPIRWQPEEVAWGTFLTLEDVDAMIERERFCLDSLEVFERWRGEAPTAPRQRPA
jgi:8-oxo-dGTP pyrophosphatase MutT (NUDIX family)